LIVDHCFLTLLFKGCAKDPELARQWFVKAAKQKDVESYNKLGERVCLFVYLLLMRRVAGEMYLHGLGTERDYQAAESWFKKGAELEDSDSHFSLGKGLFFSTPIIVNQSTGCIYYDQGDWNKSISYHRKAASKLNILGMHALAYCYYLGEGAPQDQDLGYKYLTLSLLYGLDIRVSDPAGGDLAADAAEAAADAAAVAVAAPAPMPMPVPAPVNQAAPNANENNDQDDEHGMLMDVAALPNNLQQLLGPLHEDLAGIPPDVLLHLMNQLENGPPAGPPAEPQQLMRIEPVLRNVIQLLTGKITLDEVCLNTVVPSRPQNVLHRLLLDSCGLTSAHVSELAEALKGDRRVLELSVAGNNIDEKGMTALLDMLPFNDQLLIIEAKRNPCPEELIQTLEQRVQLQAYALPLKETLMMGLLDPSLPISRSLFRSPLYDHRILSHILEEYLGLRVVRGAQRTTSRDDLFRMKK